LENVEQRDEDALSGAIFGGQIGCDYQLNGSWVIGIQGDWAGARLTSDVHRLTTDLFGGNTSTGFYHVRTDWLASVTGRLGFTGLFPQSLVYIRGGGAWIRETWQIDSESGGGQKFRNDFSQTRDGWTIGGGLEYAITDRWRIFGEYNHYDFGSKVLASGHLGVSNSGTTTFTNTKQTIETVRLGVNFRVW
jgi:outer membrane immunogenic protein